MQARHRKEAKDLQGRITNKKKNATKKTRKGVNDECADMERAMKERQAEEIAKLQGNGAAAPPPPEDEEEEREEEEGVNGKLERLDIKDEPTTTSKSSQPAASHNEGGNGGGGGGGGGKKRNRQKERLARRAAEQEAAALAAEQEASSMTDHRAIEKTYMLAEFKKHSLVEHEIRPDGHCLFSAVADQLGELGVPLTTKGEEEERKEEGYKVTRRRAAEYIQEHADDYAGFLDEDLGSYVKKIRDTAEWGGQIELSALANVYGVEIHVVQDRDTEVIGPSSGGEGEGEERKKIWLAYYRHGYGLGEHYNSLRKKD